MKSQFIISLEQDWTDLFRKCHFYNFQFLNIEIEIDRIVGRVEIYFALIGIRLFIAIPFKMSEELKKRVKDLGIEETPKSKCCNSSVRNGGLGDFKDEDRPVTQYYICDKCNKSCDI